MVKPTYALGPYILWAVMAIISIPSAITSTGILLLAIRKRRTDGMHAGDDALKIGVDQLEDFFSDARHDAHVDDGVGRVRELHANLRHRRADRAHAVGEHKHRAALHAAGEKALERLPHFERIHPVVRRPCGLFGKRADKCAVLNARDVARVGSGEVAAGPFLGIEFEQRAAGDHLRAERVEFRLRAIDPVDRGRLAEGGHLLDPAASLLDRLPCQRR